jgi:uncharacterized protein YbbC (DUF1343 family)
VLPVKPSPNLPDMSAVYWYPSTCFFEGTILSEGRGTIYPFQIFGHPALPDSLFRFVPEGMPGATDPKLKGQVCYGWNVHEITPPENKIELRWLLQAYQLFPGKDKFFLPARSGKLTDMFFNKLAGNSELMQQIKDGKTEVEIRASWQPALEKFKKIRAKYLLYND